MFKENQITIIGSGYSTLLALNASKKLNSDGVRAEVFDLRY